MRNQRVVVEGVRQPVAVGIAGEGIGPEVVFECIVQPVIIRINFEGTAPDSVVCVAVGVGENTSSLVLIGQPVAVGIVLSGSEFSVVVKAIGIVAGVLC